MECDRILKTATAYFIRYGIKGVGMSLIADALGISKRTLYCKFANKEQLIAECINREVKILGGNADRIESESLSQVEAIIMISHYVSNYTATICPSFAKDTVRYNKVTEGISDAKLLFHKRFESILERGIKNGYFMTETDPNRMSAIITEQLEKIRLEHQLIAISTLIRGISTDKGLCELERISIIN